MQQKVSANESAAKSGLWWAVMCIITTVVVFGDVMFVKLMWNHFPDGMLRICALGGAFATAASIIVLLIGKTIWFRPGGQLLWSYGFTALEVIVSILNVLYASGVQDGIMAYWELLSPATPFVALSGWILILLLDRATKRKHEDMEMEDDIAESERDFKRMQHEAAMEVRKRTLEYNKQYVLDALESPHHQRAIQAGAEKLAASAIASLTGRYIPPPPVVEGSLASPPPAAIQTRPIARPAVSAPSSPPATEPPVLDKIKNFFGMGTGKPDMQPASLAHEPVQVPVIEPPAPTQAPARAKKQLPPMRTTSDTQTRKQARLERLRGTRPLA